MRGDYRTDPSCVFTVFGGTGDLAKRLLIPALYHLSRAQLLPSNFRVVGVGRARMSDSEYQSEMESAIRSSNSQDFSPDIARNLLRRFSYFQGEVTQFDTFPVLARFLNKVRIDGGISGAILFYLATPPSLFSIIPGHLRKSGLLDQSKGHWRRVVIEKPFGHDRESACNLNRTLLSSMGEDQIYRIDHYLGKDTVQNIMSMRFANQMLEPIWNNRNIDFVQITVSEALGVEARGDFYEKTGALRDMVPNHLFQLLALVAMECPKSFGADDIRDEKVKVLRSILRFDEAAVDRNTVRGQYGPGSVGNKSVIGYRDELKIHHESTTETFAAVKLEIGNPRWTGVPYYLRTGKRMPRKLTEVVVQFKCAPGHLFFGTECGQMPANRFVFRIQPEELIMLELAAKKPGPDVKLGEANLSFDYRIAFGEAPSNGYETLLYDVMKGDSTLFQRADQIEEGWSIVDPILTRWAGQGGQGLHIYPAGSWGPTEAFRIPERDAKKGAWKKAA